MKKILLLFTALLFSCSFAWAQLGVGQQFANNDFESWGTEATWESGIIWTTTHTAYAPTNWHSINNATFGSDLLKTGRSENFVTQKTTGNYPGNTGSYVQLQCVSILGVAANGGLSTGRFNAGSMTVTASVNCTYTSTNSGYNQPLTAYPDSVYIWTKTSISNSSDTARINIVIHSNTVSSSGRKYNAIYQDPDGSDIAGSNPSNASKVVAMATLNFNTNGTWIQQKIAFDYNSYLDNGAAPAYALATLSTNQTAGEGTAGDKLFFDDIILIYNTRLASLKANNVAISSFNPDITTYTYPLCEGADFPTITFSCQSAHANATITHPATTNEPYTTIRVTHLNQESTVYKDYTINYEITNPTIPIVENNINKCYGNPIEITAIIPEGCTGYWSTGDPTVPERTGSSYLYTGNENTTINVLSHHNVAGCNSGVASVNVNVYPQIDTPVPGETTSICPGSTATFSAILPTGENLQLRWYETATSTTVLGTDNVLVIDNLTATTTRYASTYNPATGCESGRVAVTVNVTPSPAAPTAAATTSVCYGATGTFSATLPTGDNLMCHWYETATSTDLLGSETNLEVANLTANTTRYVSTYSSATTCESERVAVTVNVNALPAAPSVNNTAICGAGEATLSVQAVSGESYLWFENATGGESIHNGNSWTGDITENTTLYVEAVSAEGCHSSSRTAATATVKSVPTAPSASDASRCGTGNLTLSVNGAQDGYTYNWYLNNELVNTGINYTIENLSVTTTYNVTATLDGCESEASSVTATINAIPAAPVVYSDSVCGSGEVTLNVQTVSGNSYLWFENATGGESIHNGDSWTGDITENTTLYVEAVSSESCHSTSRTAVTAKVNAIPEAPLAQNLNLCGSGKAIMTAIPAENCICQWFNSNNEPITTGVSDDSKTLTVNTVSSSTVYYVRSYNETTQCHSENATVEVIVATIPGRPTIAGSFARCGAGELTLSATPGSDANSLRWFNSDGTQLGEGLEYTTESLSENTDFTVKSYNSDNGCVSTSNLTVTATIYPVPTAAQIVSNPSICGSGTTTLIATPGSNATTCRWINGNDTTVSNSYTTANLSASSSVLLQSYNATTKCASDNEEITITVNTLPAVATTTNDSQCVGSSVTLSVTNATENTTCRWYASSSSEDILFEGTEFHPTNLSAGEHTFYAELADNTTSCISSERTAATATMVAVPTEPSVADDVHCGPSTFTLKIENADDENLDYHWYDVAEGGEELAQGSSYTTAEISETTHFYVSASPKGFTCESPRHDITLTINAIPATPEVSGTTTLCAGQSTSLTATSDAQATGFQWFKNEELVCENATFITPALNESTTYRVKAINSTTLCESAVSNVVITVNANPIAPVAYADTACHGETIILISEAAAGHTCYWYADETSTTVIATGNSFSSTELSVGETTFYVNQKNNETGCQSTRTAVNAMVHPTYAVDYPVTACDSFVWNNETFKSTGNYERTLSSINGCDSVVTLQLTINHSYDITIDTTVCDLFVWNDQEYRESDVLTHLYTSAQQCDSLVTINLTVLKSTVGEDHIYLCSNELPYNYNDLYTVTAAGIFDVHTTNAAGCDSTIHLTVTVNNQPALATNLTSGARCGEGSVRLSATFGTNGTTCRWYASETSEEVLFEGGSFNTPSIAETSTYYVSSYNNYNGHPCESGRQAVIATVNANPTAPVVENQVRCGDGEISFTAQIDESATTCRWYLTNTATTPSETGLEFSTNIYVINGETFFYVESYNANTTCKSEKQAVTATAYPIPAAPVLAGQSNCGPARFHINAPATGFYKWYDNAESTVALDITDNTTPLISASRNYYISQNINYSNIICESKKSVLALTIYPVYEPQVIFDTLCQGDTYTQHGIRETFDEAGSFDRIINTISSNGCDSLVTLRLWVKEIRNSEFSATECVSYTWNDETFTQSGDFVRHFTSSIGCDSVVTLHLTINPVYNKTVDMTICESALPFTWNDKTFPIGTPSGNYEHTYFGHAQTGCDSTVKLQLTISNQYVTNLNKDICEGESYNFGERVLTESGIYYDTLLAHNLCDSIIILKLNVHELHTTLLNDEICLGETYVNYGFNITPMEAGSHDYEKVVKTSFGCDSTVKLTLVVHPSYTFEPETASICDNETYVWEGHNVQIGQRTAGTYIIWDSLTTANGCDSVYKLTLTVNPSFYNESTATTCDNIDYVWTGHEHIQIGQLDAGTYTFWDSLMTMNQCDSVYKLTLNVNQTKHTDLYASICHGEVYTYNNKNYSTAGDYDHNFETTLGCDSIVTLHLTVNPTFDIDTTVSICEGALPYTFADTIFYQGGSKDVFLHTQFGCDSIYHVTLQVNPFLTKSVSDEICDNELPYHYLDSTFYRSGVYEITETHDDGCNEITTLTLTVNPTYEQDDYATACGSYTLVRPTYSRIITQSGIYTDTLSTVKGCDSIVHLHLTIYPTYYYEEEGTTCDNETYVWEGHNIQIGQLEAREYTFWDSLTTINGCDSIYKLTLTVHPSYYFEESDESCDNETYVWEGHERVEIGQLQAGTYTFWDSLKTVNQCDSVYELTLTVNPTFYQEENAEVCDNETYVWEGHERVEIGQLQAGTYTFWDSLKTGNQCDSVYTLTLTVNPTFYQKDEDETCDNSEYVWEGHEHIQIGVREEGTYTFWDSLKTINSCDSVYELTLTVNPSYDVTFDTTVCDLFVWNEEEYTESGIFTQNFTTINNCDSVISVHLTVNHSYDISIDTTVCDLFVWNNQEYTESDVLTHLYTSAQQCDSLVTINLTVNHSVEQNETLTICQSQLPYPWRDTTFEVGTVSGEYTFVRETAQHCDSVVILNLTVNPNNEFFDDPVIMCQGETFTWNGQVITESGLYTDTVDNQYGCYDVYKLLVTVHPTYDFYEYDTVCQNELPIEWRGRSFNAAASYDFVYPTINNCDSTYHFTLTVNPSYLYEENDDVCANKTYVWEGHEYIQIEQMAVGTHTIWDSLTTVNGCDSVYKLTLNVHPTYYFEESDNACDNEDYVWEGHETVEIGQLAVGTHIIWDSLTTANGCDSVYRLTLTVNPTYFDTDEDIICDNEIYVWEGHESVEIGQLEAGLHIKWDSLKTANGCDSVFMLTLTVNPTAHSIENASACSNEDSYIWHGRTITETGIYFDTLATMLACDSVCELRFTLLEPTSATFVDTTCANSTYTAYGFNIENLPAGDTTLLRVTKNSVGCDSTITVLLNVKPIFETSFDTINCGALLWNNTWYQESGQYQQVFEAANGCDSIVTMNLIVDTPSRDTAYVTACDFYEWDGTIYNQSGIYSKIYPQTVGCDSIAVLLLTINHSQEVTFYDTTCLGEIYQGYGFDTLITQVGNIQIQRVDNTIAGCDSTINVMLRVYASYLIIDSVSTCDNEPYTWQGSSYNESGTYTVSYTSVHGCDSTHVLVLEVYPTYNVDIEDTAVVGVPYHKYGLNFTPQNVGTLHIPVPNITVMGCDSILNITLEVVDGSSIEQYRLANTISLYPNPTENVFTVNSSLDAIKELTIFDNNGKAVLYQSINGNNGSVNVEALAPGIYFVQLETEHGIVHKKLIVR